MARVIIIGGGASGLASAIFAVKNGNKVTVLEHKDRVGKKILMTGNGRCNLTSMNDFYGKYYSSDEASIKKIYDTLNEFNASDTRAFFKKIGLYTKEKRDGGVYPVSEQASVVLDVLMDACENAGVELVTNCNIQHIKPEKSGGCVEVILTDDSGKNKKCSFPYEKLILATGGKAAPVSGSDGSGYQLAKQLGHYIIKPLPALVQLRCDGNFFKSIAGVRVQAALTLYVDGKNTACDTGELQLTDYGISGIPVFQFSRIAARALDMKKKCEADINFITYVQQEDKENFIKENAKAEYHGCKTVERLLSGMVHKKLAAMICRKNNISATMTVSDAGEQAVRRCISELFSFRVKITGTKSFENAQVCSGGVPLSEVDNNFASRICKDVYIVGELLDCDGICGGYNLQWAWATGAIAGGSINSINEKIRMENNCDSNKSDKNRDKFSK